MTTYFISDLHLDPTRPELYGLLDDFLQGPGKDAQEIYILGDLFEVWLGDDIGLGEHQRAIEALAKVSQSGTALYFMAGNRDFLVGEAFAKAIGCQLLPDPTVITLGGQRSLLMHGDSLCTRDYGHTFFRAVTRSHLFSRFYLSLSQDKRRSLGYGLRRFTKKRLAHKSYEITDTVHKTLCKKLAKYNAAFLIHGHTHRPSISVFNVKGELRQTFVLSDWHEQGNFLRFDNDEFELHNFS